MVVKSLPKTLTVAGETALFCVLALFVGCGESGGPRVKVSSTLEDLTTAGDLHTPSTQSFLRGKHWLETIEEIEIITGEDDLARVKFYAADDSRSLEVVNIPLDQLAPRLHYQPADPPDEFDAYNLMLAEFSRNSLSVPIGKSGDQAAHFETDLAEGAPWKLIGDYDFQPNPFVRPIRVGVINNCLRPGLWELSASDRSGEIYHSWFDMPDSLYRGLVARANGVSEQFASTATQWSTEPVSLALDRLREVTENLGRCSLTICSGAGSGYSSQDSRRKLAKGYALINKDGKLQKPEKLSELTESVCYLSDFVEPGKYSFTNRREFDLSFLSKTDQAEVTRVTPRTDYNWLKRTGDRSHRTDTCDYLELVIRLQDVSIIIGNLPMRLLVPQEDFALNGFGVGTLASSGLAERRKYLINDGPAPSFAYLCQGPDSAQLGLNSHDFGIEQIFIRTHINDRKPWWEVTVTSFERMVDLVKYRIEIPPSLHDELNTYALEYIAPLHRTYRDDNLR